MAALSAKKYGPALDCIIREVVIADPTLGPVYVLKAGVSDRFYCIVLRSTDTQIWDWFFPQTEAERRW